MNTYDPKIISHKRMLRQEPNFGSGWFCCMKTTAEEPIPLKNPVLLAKPAAQKPSPLEQQLRISDSNYKYCLEKGDVQRALMWAQKRNHLRKLFAESRNGEQHVQCIEHDDPPCERNA